MFLIILFGNMIYRFFLELCVKNIFQIASILLYTNADFFSAFSLTVRDFSVPKHPISA